MPSESKRFGRNPFPPVGPAEASHGWKDGDFRKGLGQASKRSFQTLILIPSDRHGASAIKEGEIGFNADLPAKAKKVRSGATQGLKSFFLLNVILAQPAPPQNLESDHLQGWLGDRIGQHCDLTDLR
jgi:hypothetical protein